MFDGTLGTRPVVLSIRPTYIERILDGRKTVELRRRFPISATPRSLVILYSTSPVQSIVAIASLEAVIEYSIKWLWRMFGDAAAVTRREFNEYFDGRERGCALRLSRVRAFDEPIHLRDLVRQFDFSPPQSFCYWKTPIAQLAAHGRVEIPS